MSIGIGGWIFLIGVVGLGLVALQLWSKGAVDRDKARTILTEDGVVIKSAGTRIAEFFKRLFTKKG